MDESERQKYHLTFVDEVLHKHPDEFPKAHPITHPPPYSEEEIKEEVKEFDKYYKVKPDTKVKPTI